MTCLKCVDTCCSADGHRGLLNVPGPRVNDPRICENLKCLKGLLDESSHQACLGFVRRSIVLCRVRLQMAKLKKGVIMIARILHYTWFPSPVTALPRKTKPQQTSDPDASLEQWDHPLPGVPRRRPERSFKRSFELPDSPWKQARLRIETLRRTAQMKEQNIASNPKTCLVLHVELLLLSRWLHGYSAHPPYSRLQCPQGKMSMCMSVEAWKAQLVLEASVQIWQHFGGSCAEVVSKHSARWAPDPVFPEQRSATPSLGVAVRI